MSTSPNHGLDAATLRRYSRHILLPEVGITGQARLRDSKALVVGAGGLGSPSSLYLAAAGVGRIGLVDFDIVDESNLQRQILYGTQGVGQPKLEQAQARLEDLNPDIEVIPHATALDSSNAIDLIQQYDIVLDGTDNFPTRYLVNDACVLAGKPNAYGSIFRFEGQASVFHHDGGPCYRCLYPNPPPPGLVPSCAEGGVLGVLPGVIGTLQATEAIKILTGIGTTLSGRLLLYDALHATFDHVNIQRNPDCLVCGDNPTVTQLIDYQEFCNPAAHAQTPATVPEITVQEYAALRQAEPNAYLLDVREPGEAAICTINGSTLIPLGQLADRANEIPTNRTVIVHCKTGGRSAQAVQLLREYGVEATNLRGGILAWIDEVDSGQPRY